MSTKQVPQEISALIAYAEEEMEKQVLNVEGQRVKEEIERVKKQRAETEEFVSLVAAQIPDVLWDHVNLDAWVRDVQEYEDRQYWKAYVRIDVPELAPIVMEFDHQKATLNAWQVAGVVNGYFDDDGEFYDAHYSFVSGCVSRRTVDETELRFVLTAAKKSADYLAQEQARKEEKIAQYEKRKADIANSERKKKTEEQALFEALKGDAVALTLLQAFVLLRDERSHFEESLNAADEQLYSVENRWSRKAEELRRQADEIQRRADDDRMRLQSDLTDAQGQVKKMGR